MMDEKIRLLKEKIDQTDAVIIGAGAGLSTAAGFVYAGERFGTYFREYGIGGYEAPVNCGLDEWVRLKAVIHEDTAAFYLNGSETPVLAVSGMKHGAGAKGSVGLFVDIGTEGFFRDLVITQEESK